jgi:type IV pilus assembly protein PilV
MNIATRSLQRRARGFTLVEALVALLVLSIGLLGIGMMQLTSLRSNHASSLRSQATLLAYDITDRMRANRNAAINTNEYDIAIGAAATTGTVAGDDLDGWKQNLATTLPGGDGSVARIQVVNGTITTTTFVVTVQWDDSRGAEAPLAFVMETQI